MAKTEAAGQAALILVNPDFFWFQGVVHGIELLVP